MQVFKLFSSDESCAFQHHACLWEDSRILKKCATAIFKVDSIISSDLGGGARKTSQL
jgi:hypothetical protein